MQKLIFPIVLLKNRWRLAGATFPMGFLLKRNIEKRAIGVENYFFTLKKL
jgi:hypothetical protein